MVGFIQTVLRRDGLLRLPAVLGILRWITVSIVKEKVPNSRNITERVSKGKLY